jgi:hypothetical protein
MINPARKAPFISTAAQGHPFNELPAPLAAAKAPMKAAPRKSRKKVIISAGNPVSFENTPMVAISTAEKKAQSKAEYGGALDGMAI